MKPLVSVVIPTYNRAEMLKRAIKSVLDQGYDNLEILVIDDGSTDDTGEVVRSFNDERIVFHPLQSNKGVSAARNEGIKLASGEYIAFLDSDDEYVAGKLDRCLDVFQSIEPTPGMVFTNLFRCSGERRNKPLDAPEGFVDLSRFPASVFLPPSTWVLASDVIDVVGFFDEELKRNEDTDFFARVVRSVPVYFLNEPLLFLHVHDSDVGRNIEGIADGIRHRLLEKWFSEMKKDPKYLGDFYYCAGKHHFVLGDNKRAVYWLWKALVTNPFKARNYERLFRALLRYFFRKRP